MKGIVLAGGSGTRLYPVTKGVSKHLIPIYDKPMVFYPLSVLMLAGINDILIITTPEDKESYVRLLGDGSNYGIKLSYAEQPRPEGLAQAFIIGEEFIGKDSVCLILGDNIFYGPDLTPRLRKALSRKSGATVFGYFVKNPEQFGVVEFDKDLKAISIEEKPSRPRSNLAMMGIYRLPGDIFDFIDKLNYSRRGELELTDAVQALLADGRALSAYHFSGEWLDIGSPSALLDANQRFLKRRITQNYASTQKHLLFPLR
jgi:glucose-1-phosphate thymidylyltransferase